MAKDPAVLFYTSDFLTGTMLMTYEQKGKYITLLCLQHQKGVLCEKDMFNICQSYDKDIFDKFTKDGDNYYNKRMREEFEKRSKYSKSRSENRLKGLKNKEKKESSYDNHMENENEDIIINTSLNKKERILKNQQWIEQICMNKRQELSFVTDYLTIFLDDLELKQDLQKEDKEIQSHFINWFNLNLEKLKKNDNGSTKSRRQRFIDSVKN